MTRPSRFEGRIGRTIADSEAWYDEPPHPGADAPNVVIVLLDDTGFAQFGCTAPTSTPRTSTTLHEVVIQLLSPNDLAARKAEAEAEMSRQ